MSEGVDLGVAFFEEPKDALRYFEEKGFRTGHWNWWDTWQEANARAFVIARTARLDVQQTIRDRLREAIAKGMTDRAFVRGLTPELQRMGWWGRKVVVDSAGNAESVQEGSPWRLRTIYRANVFSAYGAGRWKQQVENAESRPYWMYVAVMDGHTRPSHAAMHGRVFRYDDPIWRTHYPPCAFGCRCRVIALTERQVRARGLVVESSEGRMTQVTQQVGVNQSTGEVIERPGWQYTAPDGSRMTPAPGWGYNPGQAAFQPDLDRYDYDIARQYVEGSLTGPAFARQWRKWDDRVAQIRSESGRIGDAAIREMLKREADSSLYWPVAILSPDDRALLRVGTQVARLSDWTMAKQAVSRSGQDFGLDAYWRVQPTIEHALAVLRDRKPTGTDVYLFYGVAEELYVAVLKPVRNTVTDGDELYVDSFRRSNARELERARKRFEIVR